MLLKGDILADGSRVVSVTIGSGTIAAALDTGDVLELPPYYVLDVDRPPKPPDEPVEPPELLPGIDA